MNDEKITETPSQVSKQINDDNKNGQKSEIEEKNDLRRGNLNEGFAEENPNLLVLVEIERVHGDTGEISFSNEKVADNVDTPSKVDHIFVKPTDLVAKKRNVHNDNDIADAEAMWSDDESALSVHSEYAPSEHGKDDNSSSNSSNADENEPSNDTGPANSSCDSSNYVLQMSFNVPGNSACDERNQIAELSHGATGGQKKNFCIYCKTVQSKIARHLTNKHPDKEEVKRFLSLPKKNIERNRIIASIRKKGNFLYNVISEYNNGQFIPVRRPRQDAKRPAENFVPCSRCRGFYSRNNIRHHHRHCAKKTDNSRHVLAEARKTLGRIHESASLVLRQQVFPVLRDDNITRIIRYDKLVILYGNKMCKKLRLPHQHDEIRAHLRRLGRFIEAIREIEPSITDMASVFDPRNYNAAIEAVNVIAQLNPKTQLYKIPSVAAAIGCALKKLGHIMEAECIKDHDIEKKRNVKDFLKLLLDDYGTSVNKGVTETMAKVQRTKKVTLPKTNDIKILHDFLDKAIDKATSQLNNKFDLIFWKDLAEALLIKLQSFNRRRAGEIERFSIEEFENRQNIKDDDELYQKLNERDKTSAKKYVRVEIRGKLNRTVPVLLSRKVLEGVNLVLKHRKAAGVPSSNPFIFGIASTDKDRHRHLRACILMRKFSMECGAQEPSTLRGTTLRKHIATRCADMNLTDNQISSVAKFMGHHENIHRNIYRQPVVKSDIVEMSKVLEKAQGQKNDSESREHDSADVNSTSEQQSATDFNSCGASMDDSNVSPVHPCAEITPPNKKRLRSESEDSAETLETPVPPKPMKSKRNKETRMTSTPIRESTSERKVRISRRNKNKKPRSDSILSPNLTAIISTSSPKRVTRSSAERRAAVLSPLGSSFENVQSMKKKKIKEKASRKSSDISQSSQSSLSGQSDTSTPSTITKYRRKGNVPTNARKKYLAPSTAKKPRWGKEEIQQALECFGSYLEVDKLPSLPIIEKIKKDRNNLQGRSSAVIKTWLSNQLRITRNGGTPQYALKSDPVSKAVLEHAEFIFEEYIANGKVPTVKDCEEVRKHDKKIKHLSAIEIRNIAKSLINT